MTDSQAAAEELVAAANRQGGRDNVSVIVVDVLDGVDPPPADEELDIEPVWQPEPPAGTWAVADPSSTEPEEFDDLAALASAQGVRVVTPAGGTGSSPPSCRSREHPRSAAGSPDSCSRCSPWPSS